MYNSLAGLSEAAQKKIKNEWYRNNTNPKSQEEIDKDLQVDMNKPQKAKYAVN